MFDPRVWQERNPPRPVRVDISKAFPNLSLAATRADRLPLWIRSAGVRLELTMDGEVLGVCRLTDGQWLINVRIRPRIGNAGTASMELWVTQEAVSAWPDGNLNTPPIRHAR
ncbi:hypothetical protein FK268_23280 [Tsukamurella sputi]|uniref:Uncharacterized protein n=2 Tax=Tsukamurella TaxID=2060 RepID=A0A5C5RG37_9ACTN|nr:MULTISPECIES: hypothetical protein [Tsukamurella]RDB48311.1 hypothetical protein DVB87_08610 [Tsukamurella tyrosinosolvens]TWS21658.1 hypothetical protein FK268_23280 [Tsukamurella sputi]TWS24572.1 hypothetical protein FK530_23845 [Tsukamurella conjunctivitidis]